MNANDNGGKLTSTREQVRVRRNRLAGDSLEQAAGKFDRLIGVLQEKYGYNRERATRELKRRMAKLDDHKPAS